MVDVFTDGSAFLQDVAEFTISASAAVLVQGDNGIVLDAGLVPGADHSSYRGKCMHSFSLFRKFGQYMCTWTAARH